jgi:hypothetical protein
MLQITLRVQIWSIRVPAEQSKGKTPVAVEQRERERDSDEFLADASSLFLFPEFHLFIFFSKLLFQEEAPCLLGLSSGTLSLPFAVSIFVIWVSNEMGILAGLCNSP